MSASRLPCHRKYLRTPKGIALSVLTAWGLSLGCSAPPAEALESDALRSSLVAGQISPAERDAVVFIRANRPDGAFDDCSGTLVSPDVVITAKHCVTLVQSGEFICSGAGVLLEDGHGGGLFGAKVEPSAIEVYTGTAPVGVPAARGRATFSTQSGDACHDDVATIVLDTPIERPSYPSLRSARPTVIGETVMLVGYGVKTRGALIERRELPDVRIVDVGHAESSPSATTPPRTFTVAGGTSCFGDSGGPALAMETGALTGIYSRISGDCLAPESRNTFMLAQSFGDVFDLAFAEAGERPTLETPADSPGVDGAAGAPSEPSTPEPTRHGAVSCALGPTPAPGPFASTLLGAGLLALSRRLRRRG